MEKFFMEMSRHSSGDRDLDNKSPSITSAQNVSASYTLGLGLSTISLP